MSIEDLANEIACYLFHGAMDEEAQRLVMETERQKLSGAGWCKSAVRDAIADRLRPEINRLRAELAEAKAARSSCGT